MASGSPMVTAHIHASVPHRVVQKRKPKIVPVEKQAVQRKQFVPNARKSMVI